VSKSIVFCVIFILFPGITSISSNDCTNENFIGEWGYIQTIPGKVEGVETFINGQVYPRIEFSSCDSCYVKVNNRLIYKFAYHLISDNEIRFTQDSVNQGFNESEYNYRFLNENKTKLKLISKTGGSNYFLNRNETKIEHRKT
jgi:hypothetical protein